MKRHLYRLLLLCACLLGWLHSLPLRAEGHARDSLLALLPQMPHDSVRLKTLVNLTYAFQQDPKEAQIVRWLIDEARLQGDLRSESTGLYMLMLHCYNNEEQIDSLEVWQKRILQIARKTGQWKHYFQGKELLISLYSEQHRYEYAIQQAREMAQEASEKGMVNGTASAYYCLAATYSDIHQPEQEYEALQQAYRLFPQLDSDGQKLDILASLVKHCADHQRWEELKQYGEELLAMLHDNIRTSLGGEAVHSTQLIYTESYLMLYYVHQGDYDTARRYMEQIRRSFNEQTYLLSADLFLSGCVEYYKAIGAYEQALACSDTIWSHQARRGERNSTWAGRLYRRGELLQQMGRYKEAVHCFKQSQQWQDSINSVISDEQVEEIKREHHLEQILIRQANLREKTQWAILILVIVLLVVCALYIRHIRHLHKALSQAQQETQEATRQSEKANEVKGLFLNNLRQKISKPIDTVVQLSQQLASDSTLSADERQRAAQTITENTGLLIQLVNSVLDLSRLEADMTKWQLGPCDLIQTCRDAITSVQMHRPSTQITFICSLPSQQVETDGKRMMQLIESCLSSAVNPLCPHGDIPRQVQLHVELEGTMLRFRIWGSHLASPCKECYEKAIRNDINRLTIKHFGGEYILRGETPQGALLEFTYPIA